MKKFLALFWKVVSVPITFIVAFAMQFWWLYLILLSIGAYKTAAKEWGVFAGIVSIALAFILPISSFVLWCAVWSKDEKRSRATKKQENSGHDSSSKNDGDYNRNQSAYLRLLSSMMAKNALVEE